MRFGAFSLKNIVFHKNSCDRMKLFAGK